MNTILPNTQSSAPFTGMNSGWGHDNNDADTYNSLDVGDADLSMQLGATDEASRYAPRRAITAIITT